MGTTWLKSADFNFMLILDVDHFHHIPEIKFMIAVPAVSAYQCHQSCTTNTTQRILQSYSLLQKRLIKQKLVVADLRIK